MSSRWIDPRRVLARHGLAPRRRFSQNFLVAERVVSRIAAATDATEGDVVIELGAGLGTLTRVLLETGATVVAVDQDPAMLAVLAAELGGEDRVKILAGDATTIDLAALRARTRSPLIVAGNLPYAVTGEILRNLMAHAHVLERAIVMVQREVAARLVAKPATRAYGALTVFASRTFTIDKMFDVSPASFHPRPEVHSSVVALVPRANVPLESNSFRAVVRASFDARRKTLRNALIQASTAAQTDDVLSAANLKGERRGETLSVEEFERLAHAWAQTGSASKPSPRR